jgi:hypothetical protein
MERINYSGRPPIPSVENFAPKPGEPSVYFLTEDSSKEPFYIGEYGKAKTYNVIKRIQRHFANSGTLRRVALNLAAFGINNPSAFSAYIEQLPDEYRDDKKRKSLEAWIIHIVCHELKMQSSSFCVVKYEAPSSDEEKFARQIIDEFARSA